MKTKIPKRVEIIQFLMDRYGYQSYLEIGTAEPPPHQGREVGLTWNHISCSLKHGVDPAAPSTATHAMTSDAFFDALDKNAQYDLIFIDGLHEAEQVGRDIANALTHLAPNGTIVVHDCNPVRRCEQQVPWPTGQSCWTGDVWRTFVHYRRRPDLEMYTIDADHGIGIIRRGHQETLIIDDPTYDEFDENRELWLNLITVASFYEREG